MAIKSLEELQALRESLTNKVTLRNSGESTEEKIEVLVGMATCGIAAGADETYTAFEDELKNQGLENVDLVKVGCIGYCHSEPTVQINVAGKEPVIYGGVNKEVAKEIVSKHIKNNEILENGSLAKIHDVVELQGGV